MGEPDNKNFKQPSKEYEEYEEYILEQTAQRIRKNLKVLRCYLAKDQTEFGELTGTGKRIGEVEQGRLKPTLDELKKVAHYCKVPLHSLLFKDLTLTLNT